MDPGRKIGPSIPLTGAKGAAALAKNSARKSGSNPFADFQDDLKVVRPVEGIDEFVSGSLDRLRFETYSLRKRWGASEVERQEASDLQLFHNPTVRGTTSLDPLKKDAYGAELMGVMHQMSMDQKINPRRRQAGLRLPRYGEHVRQAQELKWVIRPDLQPAKKDNAAVEDPLSVDVDQMVRDAIEPETLVEKFVKFLLVPVVPLLRVDMETILLSMASPSSDNPAHMEIEKAVEAIVKRTMKKMDNNANAVLSGAEWDAGLSSTGWVEYYDELHGPDVSSAEHKRVSKALFLDLCKGKGLLNYEQFLSATRLAMANIGRRGELARIRGIALRQKRSGNNRVEEDVKREIRKSITHVRRQSKEIQMQMGIPEPHEIRGATSKIQQEFVAGALTIPSKQKRVDDNGDPMEMPEASGPGSKSSSPRKEGVQLAIPSEGLKPHSRERRSPRADEVLQTIDTAVPNPTAIRRGQWTLSDFRRDFVRITVFPNGDRHHKGAEVYINKKLPWADVLQQAARDARPLCGPVMALYDTDLQLVRSSVDALVDGASYLACSGEKPNAWPRAFPTTRSAPKFKFSPVRPVAEPLSTTSTMAQLLRLQEKREMLSSVLNKKILERARKFREETREDEFYGTFSETFKPERSRSEPNLK
jgi:hypothetical protein